MSDSPSDVDYTAELKGSLKLSKSGEWWHNGVPFKREKLSNLFHRSIVWDEKERQYFVKIGRQRARFDLEDTAYFVMKIEESSKAWQVLLNDGSLEALNPLALYQGKENQLYLTVKGNHLARFSRSAHQRILTHAIDENTLLLGGIKAVIHPLE